MSCVNCQRTGVGMYTFYNTVSVKPEHQVNLLLICSSWHVQPRIVDEQARKVQIRLILFH